jgi:cytochrome c-type biogenesis protein CcmF
MGAVLRAFNAVTPLLGFSFCVFNAAVIVQEFSVLLRSRAKTGASGGTPSLLWWLGGLPGLVHTLFSLPPASRRRYGGYVVHLGIILMFVGFTGQSWNVDREVELYPGQTADVGSYTIAYRGTRMEVDNSKRMIIADVDVLQHGKMLWPLHPAKLIYKKQPEAAQTEAAIGHGFRDDVYLALGTVNPSNKLAALQVHINPLVTWIWIGCLVLIAGSVVCMWPQVEPGESRVWVGARGVAATAASVFLGIMLAATPAARAQTMPEMSGPNSGTVRILNDAERSVFGKLRCMCGTCARDLLSTCTCETAEEARQSIRAKLAQGEQQDQILAEYSATYGAESLAVPPNTGVFRAIWAVPVAAIGLGAIGVGLLIRRWRGAGGDHGSEEPVPGSPSVRDEYDDRLDDDLKDLDG